MPEEIPGFIATQQQFTAHIRDPENNLAPPEVKTERMAMYRELFFNNINSFIQTNFPVLHGILDESHWQELVQDFFSRHACQTPYFSEIAEEFIDYLVNEREQNQQDPSFLSELAHYEWVELHLSISRQEAGLSEFPPAELLKQGRLDLSALAMVLVYDYPVHRICREFQPHQPPQVQTCLVVYRNRDYEVRFLEINVLTCQLLQLIKDKPGLQAMDYLEQIVMDANHPDPDVVLNAGSQMLERLIAMEIVVPVKP